MKSRAILSAAALALFLCSCGTPAPQSGSQPAPPPSASPAAPSSSPEQETPERVLTLVEPAGAFEGVDGYRQEGQLLAGVCCRFDDEGKLEEIEEVIPPLLSFPDLPDCTIRESEANIEVYPDRARVSRTAQITYTVPYDPPEVGGDILSVEPGADGYIVSTKAKTFALEISAEDLEQNAAAD